MNGVILRPWLIWLTAGIFYLFEFIHRVAISVMIPELMASFNVSIAVIGNISACYFYAYALAQIPVGLTLDRYSTRNVLTYACLTLTVASVLFALTSNILLAELCRIVIGLGSAFAFVGCLKIGTLWFRSHNLGLIIGLTNLLGITGAIIGGKPTALAVDSFGWRNVMLASGAVGLIITLMLYKIISDGDNGALPQQQDSQFRKIKTKLWDVCRNKQIWIIGAFAGFMVAPITTYSELWGVSFLVNHYHLDRPTAAQISTMTFIGIAVGGPTIGWFSDLVKQRKLPMLYGAVGALITMGCILVSDYLPFWLNATLHFAFGFFTSSMLQCFTLASESITPMMRATTIALVNSIIMAMGALFQSFSGVLLSNTKADFNVGFAPLIVCYVLAFICYNHIHERGET